MACHSSRAAVFFPAAVRKFSCCNGAKRGPSEGGGLIEAARRELEAIELSERLLKTPPCSLQNSAKTQPRRHEKRNRSGIFAVCGRITWGFNLLSWQRFENSCAGNGAKRGS